jgi:hypothetical protein
MLFRQKVYFKLQELLFSNPIIYGKIFVFAILHFKIKDFIQFIKIVKKDKYSRFIEDDKQTKNTCNALYWIYKCQMADTELLKRFDPSVSDNEALMIEFLLAEGSLECASERLKNKKSIVKLISCQKTWHWRTWFLSDSSKLILSRNYKFLSEKDKKNPSYLKSVIAYNGRALEYASEELKQNVEFVEQAIANTSFAYKFAPNWYLENISYSYKNITHIEYFFEFLPKSMKNNLEFLLDCLQSDFSVIENFEEDFIYNHFDLMFTGDKFFQFISCLGHKNNTNYIYDLLISNKKQFNEDIFKSLIKYSDSELLLFKLEDEFTADVDKRKLRTFEGLLSQMFKTFSNETLSEIKAMLANHWRNVNVDNRFAPLFEKLENMFSYEQERRKIEAVEVSNKPMIEKSLDLCH